MVNRNGGSGRALYTASSHIVAWLYDRLDRELDALWEVEWLNGRPHSWAPALHMVEDARTALYRGYSLASVYDRLDRACDVLRIECYHDETATNLPAVLDALGALREVEDEAHGATVEIAA